MRAHAKLSPSSAHRWMRCPGSVRLCEGVVDDAGVAAAEGTYAHALAAVALNGGADATTFLGSVSGCQRFEVDEDFAESLQVYLDAVRMLPMLYGKGTLAVETRVKLARFGISEVWGTSDAIFESPRRLDVMDLKFGRGVYVDEHDSEQLQAYALGALCELDEISLKEIDVVGLHIVQPRHWRGPAWRTVDVTRSQLIAFGYKMIAAVKATEAADAPLVPGDEQCQWCPALAKCPAAKDAARELAPHVFEEPSKVGPPVNDIEPAALAKMLEAIPRAERWFAALYKQARALAKRGELPGYKIVEKLGNRRWIDEAKAESALIDAGVPPLAPAKIISPAEAKRRLKKKKNEGLVDPLTERPTSEALVEDSDKRRAIGGASPFEGIAE